MVLLGRKRAASSNRLHDAIARDRRAAPVLYPLDLEGASPDDYAELAQRIDADSAASTACCIAPPSSAA